MDPLLAILVPPAVAIAVGLGAATGTPARVLRGGVLLVVVPYLICLLWAFPTLDDWTYAASGRHDWWLAQTETYRTWSGRVVATLALTSWGLAGTGPWTVALAYHAGLLAVSAGLGWALWAGAGLLVPAAWRTVSVLAVAASWLVAMPSLREGLYWLAGTVTYQGGAALALTTLVLVARAAGPAGWILAAVAGALATLSNETVAVVMGPLVALVAWMRRPAEPRPASAWIGPGLVLTALLAAFLVLALCPGNSNRLATAQQEGSPSGPREIVPFLAALLTNASTVLAHFHWFAVAPVLALAAFLPPPPAWLRPGRVILITAGLFLLALAPMTWTGMLVARAGNPLWLGLVIATALAAWSLSHRAPWSLLLLLAVVLGHRAWTGASLPLIVGGWSVFAAVVFLARWPRERILVGAALGLTLASVSWVQAVGDALLDGPGYAGQQMRRLALLAAASPGTEVGVPPLEEPIPRTIHLDDLHFATTAWYNQGVAGFYGLATVRLVLPPGVQPAPAVDQPSGSSSR